MKKTLIIVLTSLSVLMILDTNNAGHALAMFLLGGVIPGTNIVIDAGGMLAVICAVFGFIATRAAAPFTQRLIAKTASLLEIRRATHSSIR